MTVVQRMLGHATSSGSTKRSKSTCGPYRQRRPSPSCNTRWTHPGLLQQHPPTSSTATPYTPIEAFNDRPKAFPSGYQIPHYRVRHDKIDAGGVITLRYNSRVHHIGLSKHLRGTKVIVLIDDLDIRVLNRNTGTLIRKLVLDPTRNYQPRGVKCGNSPENRV